MKYIIILIIILISLLLILDVNENYYTFFIPFLKTNNEDKIISYKNYYNKNIKIGYTSNYFIDKLRKILILSIKNSKFFNFTLSSYNIDKQVYNDLISDKIDLGILSNIYLFNNINNINNSIEFICNIATPTVYFLYNRSNNYITSIFEKDLVFRTLENNRNILTILLDDPIINIEKDISKLEEYIYTQGTDIILFVDDNPSNILKKIIDRDYEHLIEIIPINYKNIKNKLGSNLFNSTYIKIDNLRIFEQDLISESHKLETLYYFDSLYTKKNNNNKYIYDLVNVIFKYKSILDLDIQLNNFSFSPSFIITNLQALEFYKEINLISDIDDPKCMEIIGKMECNKKNINKILSSSN